jgi:hypothetical protein
MKPEGSLLHSQVRATCPCPELCGWTYCNKMSYSELLAPRPTPKLEDHPFLAVCNCLFNIFAATLHIRGRSSIHNLRTRHAVVTGTHLSCICNNLKHIRELWKTHNGNKMRIQCCCTSVQSIFCSSKYLVPYVQDVYKNANRSSQKCTISTKTPRCWHLWLRTLKWIS